MSDILNFNVVRALDLDGYPVPGAQALFFDSGTDTPREVFADPDGNVAHPAPLLANAEGVFPPVFVLGGSSVRAEVRDANGGMLTGYPQDPAIRVAAGGSGASQVSFNPTGDIPATDVQAAVEQVQANLVAPLLAGGIGVTGNAVLLASLDATNTASGFYRYDGDTSGTFPSGVTKANGGIVELLRKSSSAAEMTLYPTGDAARYRRELAATWGSWSKSLDEASHSEATWEAAASSVVRGISPVLLKAVIDHFTVGRGQAWQNVTASRAHSAIYTNETPAPIQVAIVGDTAGVSRWFQIRASSGSAWVNVAVFSENGVDYVSIFATVPPGAHYRVDGNVIIASWSELR